MSQLASAVIALSSQVLTTPEEVNPKRIEGHILRHEESTGLSLAERFWPVVGPKPYSYIDGLSKIVVVETPIPEPIREKASESDDTWGVMDEDVRVNCHGLPLTLSNWFDSWLHPKDVDPYLRHCPRLAFKAGRPRFFDELIEAYVTLVAEAGVGLPAKRVHFAYKRRICIGIGCFVGR